AAPPAFDGCPNPGPAESRLPKVRAVRHLAVHLAAIRRPAVTRLTIALLQVQPHPFRHVGRIRYLRVRDCQRGCASWRCDARTDRWNREPDDRDRCETRNDVHTRTPRVPRS